MILFDHEKLDVYQLELAFISWVTTLFEDLKDQKPGRVSEVCDHLDRASLSSLFNTAEGNGKRQRATRAKFFSMPEVQQPSAPAVLMRSWRNEFVAQNALCRESK